MLSDLECMQGAGQTALRGDVLTSPLCVEAQDDPALSGRRGTRVGGLSVCGRRRAALFSAWNGPAGSWAFQIWTLAPSWDPLAPWNS
jgi:hypothetical protein